jgi:hypothetical protein
MPGLMSTKGTKSAVASGHATAPPSSVMNERRVHCSVPPVLPTERIAHIGTAAACCAAGFRSCLCRRWVINGHRRCTSECPLYPEKRTSPNVVGTSAKCQKRTSPPHFRNICFLGKRTFTEKLSPCVRYVNSDRILRPWAAYPLRIALWFGTRTSECWSKELRTRGGWSPLDPLC